MIIKKFQGKTEEEAVTSAKKELGTNVVIMNVKEIKRKGLFRILKSRLVEVTVALEEEKLQQPSEPVSFPHYQPLQTNKSNHTEVSENILEERLDNLQNLLEQQLSKPESSKATEIAEDPEEPEQNEEQSEMVIFLRLLYNTMIDNEVNEKYANQIIDDVEKNNKPNMPIDYVLSNIYQKMILKFGKSDAITPAQNGPKVVFFVGPTGVGKTTTIAKIASKFKVEDGKKIALLTADTYRIAAAEQLRTYANILDVPFRIIYSTEEAQTAMCEFKQYDYILIDTAGHSHQNEAQKDSMNELIHCIDPQIEQEVYLVVSATTKYRDLTSITDTYAALTKFKLIFTKLDETTTLGNLLNLKLHTGASLSYVTCGQNVPDDIEIFNPQKTVKQLLGGKRES
ncbi:MAG: flagellar biosynthesis protein FlhF [Lachnospiraceae bacterium]